MTGGTLSVTLVLFTALTLTHAAFVNYRSGAAETQPQFRVDNTVNSKSLFLNEMIYLQTRKFAGPELLFENYVGGNKRGIWRGPLRSSWTENGLCCGVFELLVRMRGSATRATLLRSLRQPKNKAQLARELGVDWKAVDGHIRKLLNYGLVFECALVGTCRVYAITQKGRRSLELLDRLGSESSPECS